MAEAENTAEVSKSLLRPAEIGSRQRHYETIFILSPLVNDPEAKEVAEKNLKVLNQFNATVLRQDEWGKRRMAHPMEKHQVGRYFFFRFVSTAQALKEFERSLKLDARVIRFASVVLSEPLSKTEIQDLIERAPREASSSPSIRQDDDDGMEGPGYASA